MGAHAFNTSTWEAEAGQSLKSAWSTEFYDDVSVRATQRKPMWGKKNYKNKS